MCAEVITIAASPLNALACRSMAPAGSKRAGRDGGTVGKRGRRDEPASSSGSVADALLNNSLAVTMERGFMAISGREGEVDAESESSVERCVEQTVPQHVPVGGLGPRLPSRSESAAVGRAPESARLYWPWPCFPEFPIYDHRIWLIRVFCLKLFFLFFYF